MESKVRARFVGWAIVMSVRALRRFRHSNPWPTIEELGQFPEGSFARALHDFLAKNGLPFLPTYEAHDGIHVLLGYGSSARNELEIQAFLWGNGSSSFTGRLLFLFGAAMLPEYIGAMRRAHARGRNARRLRDDLFLSKLRLPLETLREELEPRFSRREATA